MNNFQVGQIVYVPAVVINVHGENVRVKFLNSGDAATVPASVLVASTRQRLDGLTSAIRAHREAKA